MFGQNEGSYNGCQVPLRAKLVRAIYVHCELDWLGLAACGGQLFICRFVFDSLTLKGPRRRPRLGQGIVFVSLCGMDWLSVLTTHLVLSVLQAQSQSPPHDMTQI